MRQRATNASRTNRFRKRDKKRKKKISLRQQNEAVQNYDWVNLNFCCSKNCLRNMFACQDGWHVDVTRGQKYFEDLRANTIPHHFTDVEKTERGFDIFKKTLLVSDNEDGRCHHNFQLKENEITHKCCRYAWAYAHGITRNKLNAYAKRVKDNEHDFQTARARKINEGFVGETYSSLENTFWDNCLDESHHLSFASGNMLYCFNLHYIYVKLIISLIRFKHG